MQFAGGAYSWLKNNICLKEAIDAKEQGRSPYDIMNEEAAGSVPGANGLTFLPYFLGERAPRWDNDVRGCFIGLKAETTRADMIRSVMEGVTYNLSLILAILRTQGNIDELVCLGGGAKGDIWQQILADVYNAKILVPDILEEAGSMGAAVCAGVGAGIFEDFSAIEKFFKVVNVRTPDEKSVAAYKNAKADFDKFYFAIKGAFTPKYSNAGV